MAEEQVLHEQSPRERQISRFASEFLTAAAESLNEHNIDLVCQQFKNDAEIWNSTLAQLSPFSGASDVIVEISNQISIDQTETLIKAAKKAKIKIYPSDIYQDCGQRLAAAGDYSSFKKALALECEAERGEDHGRQTVGKKVEKIFRNCNYQLLEYVAIKKVDTYILAAKEFDLAESYDFKLYLHFLVKNSLDKKNNGRTKDLLDVIHGHGLLINIFEVMDFQSDVPRIIEMFSMFVEAGMVDNMQKARQELVKKYFLERKFSDEQQFAEACQQLQTVGYMFDHQSYINANLPADFTFKHQQVLGIYYIDCPAAMSARLMNLIEQYRVEDAQKEYDITAPETPLLIEEEFNQKIKNRREERQANYDALLNDAINPDNLLSRQRIVTVLQQWSKGFNEFGASSDNQEICHNFSSRYAKALGMEFEVLTAERINLMADFLANELKKYGASPQAKKNIVEIAAGNGRLTHFLKLALKQRMPQDSFEIIATSQPIPADVETAGAEATTHFFPVEDIDYQQALTKYQPTIVIGSWMPRYSKWGAEISACDSVHGCLFIISTVSGGWDFIRKEVSGFQKKSLQEMTDAGIPDLSYRGDMTEKAKVYYFFRK